MLHGLRLGRVEDLWIPFRKRKRGQRSRRQGRQGEAEEETWGRIERDKA